MKFIQQRNGTDCMLACIATAVQRDLDDLFTPDLLRRVLERPGCDNELRDEAFTQAGLKAGKDYWPIYYKHVNSAGEHERIFHGRRAIFSVTSLNNHRGHHAVVWMYDVLHDPSRQQTYKWIDQLRIDWVYTFNECPVRHP